MRLVAAALSIATVAAAQWGPPPFSGTLVGKLTSRQAASPGSHWFGEPVPGDALIGAFTESWAAVQFTQLPPHEYAVMPGGTICWFAWHCIPQAFAPAVPPWFSPTYYSNSTTMTFFAVHPHTSPPIGVSIPIAAAGFDVMFLPAAQVLLQQQWHSSWPGTPDKQGIVVPVPNAPVLSGARWDAQAVRVDPLDGWLYFSGVFTVRIA